MFFNNPAHQAIAIYHDLLAAAHRFCDESPRVNKADFIREIQSYARLSGLDKAEYLLAIEARAKPTAPSGDTSPKES